MKLRILESSENQGNLILRKGLEVLQQYQETFEKEKDTLSNKYVQRYQKFIDDTEETFRQYANFWDTYFPNAHLEETNTFPHIGTGKCNPDDMSTWTRNWSVTGVIIPYYLKDSQGCIIGVHKSKETGMWTIVTDKDKISPNNEKLYFSSSEDAKNFCNIYGLIGFGSVKRVKANSYSKNLNRTIPFPWLCLERQTPRYAINQNGITAFVYGNISDIKYTLEVIDNRDNTSPEKFKNNKGPGFKTNLINRIISKYNVKPSVYDAGDEYGNSAYDFEIGDKSIHIVNYTKGPSSNRAKNCIELSIYDDVNNEELFYDLLYLDQYDSVKDQYDNTLDIIFKYI